MIKAFLFDYDGVMTAGVHDGIPSSRLAQNADVPLDVAGDAIVSIWRPYSTGKMTDDEMWSDIESICQKSIPANQRDIWFTWQELTPLPPMVQLVSDLRAAGYPVGLLTNIIPPAAQLIREHGGYDGFDHLLLSYEIGARKPDDEAFVIATQRLGDFAPEEILFLDDRSHNTTAASKQGMQTIHVTDHDKAIAAVRSFASL